MQETVSWPVTKLVISQLEVRRKFPFIVAAHHIKMFMQEK